MAIFINFIHFFVFVKLSLSAGSMGDITAPHTACREYCGGLKYFSLWTLDTCMLNDD